MSRRYTFTPLTRILHTRVLIREHLRTRNITDFASTRELRILPDAQDVYREPSTPLPSSGTLRKRLLHRSLHPDADLVSARAPLLQDIDYGHLAARPRAKFIRALEALDRNVDALNVLHAHLSRPRPRGEIRAVIAPRDAGRVRKVRKVLLRRTGVLVERPLTPAEMAKTMRESVGRIPLVGGEEGKMFLVRDKTGWSSKLYKWEPAYAGEDAEWIGEREAMWEEERRAWGGYLRVGDTVLDEQVRVWNAETGRYDWEYAGEGLTEDFLERERTCTMM